MTQNYGELYHYGILNMKWGVRRYQNSDGSLTAAGKSRYAQNHKLKKQYIADKKEQYRNEGRNKIVAGSKARYAYKYLKETNRSYDEAHKRANKLKEKIDQAEGAKRIRLTNRFINSKANEQVYKKRASNVDKYVDSYRDYYTGFRTSYYLFGIGGGLGYATMDSMLKGGYTNTLNKDIKEERAKAHKKYD